MIKKYLTETNTCINGMFDDFYDAKEHLLADMDFDDTFFIHEVEIEPARLGEADILVDSGFGYFYFLPVSTPEVLEKEWLEEEEDIEGVYRIKKRGKSWEFKMIITRTVHDDSQLEL